VIDGLLGTPIELLGTWKPIDFVSARELGTAISVVELGLALLSMDSWWVGTTTGAGENTR
jgi:hypothetical protein